MFVKVIKRYNDSVLQTVLPEGMVFEVNKDRAKVLINAKVCVEHKVAKEEKEAKEETPVEAPSTPAPESTPTK